jgi:hypothetical protein
LACHRLLYEVPPTAVQVVSDRLLLGLQAKTARPLSSCRDPVVGNELALGRVRNNDGVAERIAHPTSRCINSSLKTYAAIFQHAHSMRVVSPSLGPLHAASLLQSRSPSRSRFMLRRLQLPRKVSPLGTQKLVREYIGQAARLRDLAASV